jgi:hypothetical protein
VAKILTQIAAQTAKPKRDALGKLVRTEYPDGASGGLLYLVVQPSGVKSLALRFRFDGISEKVTLGRLAERPADGGVTLAEGRKAAAEARHKIEQGINPAGTRRAERAESARVAASPGLTVSNGSPRSLWCYTPGAERDRVRLRIQSARSG